MIRIISIDGEEVDKVVCPVCKAHVIVSLNLTFKCAFCKKSFLPHISLYTISSVYRLRYHRGEIKNDNY
jgi:hypothetical protein